MLYYQSKSNSMRMNDGNIIVDIAHFLNSSKTKEEILEKSWARNE